MPRVPALRVAVVRVRLLRPDLGGHVPETRTPRTAAGLLVPGDLPRCATAISFLAVLASGDLTGSALFLLVLGGTVVPRAVGASSVLDLATGGTLLLAAWASQLAWYETVPGLDLAVHAVLTGLLAAVAMLVLARWTERAAAAMQPARNRPPTETVLLVAGLGAILAIVWEAGEWAGHTLLDDSIGVGYDDTVSDLVAGLVGALTAGVLTARGGRR